MELDQSDFEDWLKNPITAKLVGILQQDKTTLEDTLLTLDLADPNLDRVMAFSRGQLLVIDLMLDLSFDVLFDPKKEEKESGTEEETTPYTW